MRRYHEGVSRREFIKSSTASWFSARSTLAYGRHSNSSDPLIIDAHAHLGDFTIYGPTLSATPAELAATCRRYGIAKMIISSDAAIEFDDSESANAEVLKACRDFPEYLMPAVCFPSPYVPRINQRLETYAAQGVKVLGEVEFGTPVSDPEGISLFRKAAELDMLILVHTDPQDAAKAAAAVPNARILLAHQGTGHTLSAYDWQEAVSVALRHKNIYLETCTSIVDRGMIEDSVNALGPERLVFGTDFPLLDAGVMMAKILDARIPDDTRNLILGQNMARLLGLPRQENQSARASV